jgi:hypothetical protein
VVDLGWASDVWRISDFVCGGRAGFGDVFACVTGNWRLRVRFIECLLDFLEYVQNTYAFPICDS